MDTLQEQIAAKQAELDRLRARAPGGLGNLEHGLDVELTYSSNAIERNSLTAAATMRALQAARGYCVMMSPCNGRPTCHDASSSFDRRSVSCWHLAFYPAVPCHLQVRCSMSPS